MCDSRETEKGRKGLFRSKKTSKGAVLINLREKSKSKVGKLSRTYEQSNAKH